MVSQVIARFLVDRPIRPGMVRAILDTLTAQGGAYAPQLVRRLPGGALQRITGSRPARLLEEVGDSGITTFLRVSEALPLPVLAFSISETPRTRPSDVTLTIPGDRLQASSEIEQMLGVCKGLYVFLESTWGAAGFPDEPTGAASVVQWANFLGPELVSRIGPARLLTSAAFIVEILPDGGVMLVTHPAPDLAATGKGVAQRAELARSLRLEGVFTSADRLPPPEPLAGRRAPRGPAARRPG